MLGLKILLITLTLLVSVFAVIAWSPHSVKEASAVTLLFLDNYTNAGWSQAGSSITVNSLFFPHLVKFNNVAGGGAVDDNRVIRKLPSTLPVTGWIADFDYKFTTSSIPDMHPFVFTATSANPQLQTAANQVEVRHGPSVDQLMLVSVSANVSSPIPISPSTQYYVRVERTSTQLELFVFSDPARTVQVPGSPETMTIASTDLANLNYLQHDGCLQCGTARVLTAKLDNTRVYTP